MNNKKVLLVNPAKSQFKKESDRIIKFGQLNFGLLAMASKYPESTIIVDFQNHEHTHCLSNIIEEKIFLIGISLISAYSEESAFEIAKFCNSLHPEIPIVYGGKDHARFIANELIEKHYASAVVLGDGEIFLKEVLEEGKDLAECSGIVCKKNTKLLTRECNKKLSNIPIFDHSVYPNYIDYVPSIEVSRGCQYSCVFCSNRRAIPLKKEIVKIYNEACKIKEQYNSNTITVYFQTPHFIISNNDIKKLTSLRSQNDFYWRSQTRADYLNSDNIPLLYKAGGRVFDVGLESASCKILRSMGKTTSPKQYLKKITQALYVSKEEGLRIKLNIMLYPGENRQSLSETIEFLQKNLLNYHSISAYPTLVFPGLGAKKFINEIVNKFKGKVRKLEHINHVYGIDLGPNFSYEKAVHISRLLGKALQDQSMYIEQRKIGYYPHNIILNMEKIENTKKPFFSSADEQYKAITQLEDFLKELE
jgi:radical SAM superfamily enzyme YgiQ (UPF0313 family)